MKFNKCMRCGCFFTTSDDVCPNCKEKDQVDISSLKSYLANNETPATISSLSFNSGVSEKNMNRYFQTKEFSKFKAQINNNTDETITPIIKL